MAHSHWVVSAFSTDSLHSFKSIEGVGRGGSQVNGRPSSSPKHSFSWQKGASYLKFTITVQLQPSTKRISYAICIYHQHRMIPNIVNSSIHILAAFYHDNSQMQTSKTLGNNFTNKFCHLPPFLQPVGVCCQPTQKGSIPYP